jgi:hypothetical protein
MPLHRIDIELVRYSQRGAIYRVLYAGKILLPSRTRSTRFRRPRLGRRRWC